MTDQGIGKPLGGDERAELLDPQQPATSKQGAKPARTGGHPLRWTATVLLLVLVAVLAYGSVVARFAHSVVFDTDRYVQTVAPLASNPVLQSELADQVTNQLMSRIDVEKIAAGALTSIKDASPQVPSTVVGQAPVIADQARSLVHEAASSMVATDQFDSLWVAANRQAHQELVSVATGANSGALQVDNNGEVSVSLNAIIDTVRTNLADGGFSFADQIPDANATFVIFQSEDVVKAQWLVSALDKASNVLPWLTLLVAALAVWAAPKHRRGRALALVGASLAVAMALLAVSIIIGRSVYLDAIPVDVLSPGAAAVLFDTLAVPLRTTLLAVLAAAVFVGILGYLSGSSASATALRRGYRRAMDAIRPRKPGREPKAIERRAASLRIPLRVAIISIAVATVVLWRYPTVTVVVVTILVAVLALLVVELVARPALARTSEDPKPRVI